MPVPVDIRAELVNPPSEEQMVRAVAGAARTCYRSEPASTPETDYALFDKLWQREHLSQLEHVSLTVRLTVDRGLSHELVRHRLASFSQESTRYCNYSSDRFGNEIRYVLPTTDAESAEIIKSVVLISEVAYNALVQRGIRPEIARSVLPTCLATELVITANLREWFHILELRASSAAHPDMRRLMYIIIRMLIDKYPFVFGRIRHLLPECAS